MCHVAKLCYVNACKNEREKRVSLSFCTTEEYDGRKMLVCNLYEESDAKGCMDRLIIGDNNHGIDS